MHHVEPKAIVFLGDLTDEGEIADDEAFREYYRRFQTIFAVPKGITNIYTPGDNDISGYDQQARNKRFKAAFGNESRWDLGGDIVVYSVNLFTNEFSSPTNESSNSTNVLISHLPVIHRPGTGSYSAVKATNPAIIFSGHDHKSNEIIANATSLNYNWANPLKAMKVFDLESLHLKNKIIEIQVPSCSYRMGSLSIGYGQAIFENGLLKYSPIFVISRFYQLGLYAVVLVIIVFMRCVKRRKSNIKYEKLPVRDSVGK